MAFFAPVWYDVPPPRCYPLERKTGATISKREVPHNQEAEESVIGAMLLSRPAIEEATKILGAEDFYDHGLGQVFAAIEYLYENGCVIDFITVTDELRDRGGVPGNVDLVMLLANVPSASAAGHYAKIVAEQKTSRDLIRICNEMVERAYNKEDPYELTQELETGVSALESTSDEPEAMTIWELSEQSESNAPWIIPGALRQDWRALITGEEGTGKGVLLRVMAMATAAGFHPFTHQQMRPARTLLVDLENPTAAILETGLVIAETIMSESARRDMEYDETAFRVWHRPGGIDIRNRQDRSDFIREVAFQKPELVCIGPWYKFTAPKQGENWEEAAMGALQLLDMLRTKYGFAVVIEAHSPKGDGGKNRSLVPIGSSALMRWPEIGIGLRKDEMFEQILKTERFRGSRLKEQWPDRIVRDRKWVITGEWDGLDGPLDGETF